MFKFFIENKLISHNQSGFKPGDSCINQLLVITHEIYKSFDDGFKVRGVFLDISKAWFWNTGLVSPQDFEILVWCPAGPVLPPGEKVPL